MNVPLLDLKAQNAPLRGEFDAALARVLDNNNYILGAEVVQLESEIADYCGNKFGIACASGTDALLIALMALGVGNGDEVITTPYSFFSTVSSITRLGAKPVFVDIDAQTYNLDVSRIEAKLSPKTKVVMPVHLYGQCSEMQYLQSLAKEKNFALVEDAAQAIGAEENGKRAGQMSAIGCFSFYPSKNLGAFGDAGIMTTDDEKLANRLRVLRVHGSEVKYYHQFIGLNSRLDTMQAAVLRVKLPHLDKWTEMRRTNAARYRRLFSEKGLEGRIGLPFERENARHIYNQFVIRIADGKRRDLKNFLAQNGVGTDIYYPVPLHLQECFAYLGYQKGDLPNAELAADETLALPIYSELTEEQQNYVVEKISEFLTFA